MRCQSQTSYYKREIKRRRLRGGKWLKDGAVGDACSAHASATGRTIGTYEKRRGLVWWSDGAA